MRMICPNCSAQYEVDDNVIPDNGRDVQCSNCGHTWFHHHGDQAKDQIEESGAQAPGDAAEQPAGESIDAQEEISAQASSGEAYQAPQITDIQPDAGETDAGEPEVPDQPEDGSQTEIAATAESAPARQPLDDEVTGILREEAERETAERSADLGGLEIQPDLGLQQGPDETRANIQERMARLRGVDDDGIGSKTVAAVGVSKSRDLLPDIEEINSTLTASQGSDGKGETVEQEKRRRGGFRLGFAWTVLLFAAMALVYVYAPQIVDLAPRTEPYLADYVDWINMLRSSVDAIMQRAVDRLTGLLAQIGGDAPG